MKELPTLSSAELEVMQILWQADAPLTIQDVCDRLHNSTWKYNTVGTLLLRMAEKGAVTSEKKGRIIYYAPDLEQEEYQTEQTKKLVSKLYHGSAKDLAVTLFKSGTMTQEDIDEIRKLFHL